MSSIKFNKNQKDTINYAFSTEEKAKKPDYQTNNSFSTIELKSESDTEIEETELGVLAENTDVSGDFSGINFADLYFFTLNESNNLNISLSGTSDNPENVLGAGIYQDANQNTVPDEDEQIDIIFITGSFEEPTSTGSLDLAAGDYILSLLITENSPTTYEATLEFTDEPPINPDSTIEETDLGTITEDTNVSGDLSESNFADSYFFTLNESNNLNISLSGNSDNPENVLGVGIYQDANQDNLADEDEQIDTIFITGSFENTPSTGSLDLAAGDYILNLLITGDNPTTYEASLEFTDEILPPSNEIEETDLETLSEDTDISGDLSESNFADIYFFTLDESSNLNISLSGNSDNPENVLAAGIYRDTNQDTIPDEEEQIELITITDSFEDTVSTSSLDLAAGDYILNLLITEDSPTDYQANIDFEESNIDLLETDIFRFQNTGVPGTYLYAAAEEAQNIRDNFDNFAEEGLAFQVAVEPGDDLIPLYRFQSKTNPGTYLFAGESEREGINENFSEQFTEEGLAFYVYGAGANKETPFTRFQNTSLPGTYLFAGGVEAENIENNFPDFENEGIAFEVDTD